MTHQEFIELHNQVSAAKNRYDHECLMLHLAIHEMNLKKMDDFDHSFLQLHIDACNQARKIWSDLLDHSLTIKRES